PAQAFAATEGLVGEETLDKWIGVIEVAPDVPAGRWIPLERLKGTVDALIGSLVEQLPDQPCLDRLENAAWSMFTARPRRGEDYPDQEDLLTGGTMLLPMWESAHRDPGFYSSRFSRCGEVFCYVKMDGDGGLEENFSTRTELEETLNAALVPCRLGCVVGGGTGLRYSYIDLAVTDVENGSAIVRQVLQERNVPRRCWLLFYDCEWQDEWIGIWDDSPPPPQ